ncbi:glycogen/starch synthase [Pyrobaculum aerophilum]|uniref:Glycogen synthase (Starch (Bacterial glycogen) synthase), putative n=2 Tax=Pyrobaculum aerophilum TaxID=13773 RepID=Q8ZT56_PYRAE|nr:MULTISPECIES: glycogen synthase [Pyrobaculum]AAL64907.1 glycogen synthase (starch (bacterial glycogen) synthase), putative [Pyrobaculum aerophilum str. IM2]MCX8135429.1 glycogen synthase [Pyrobaculum aerophilum]HII47480.1 glycogen synthase [Pyrobaculum aerophilum]
MYAPERLRRIYIITFEYGGLVKVGGLGEAVRQYAVGLASRGYDVTVLMPSHGRHLDPHRGFDLYPLDFKACGNRLGQDGRAYPYCIGAEITFQNGVKIVMFKGLDYATGHVFDRWGVYEYTEEKAALFARAVVAFAERFGLPDLIHINDWPTVLAGVALKDLGERRGLAIPTLFTIHLSWDYSFPWHYAEWSGLANRQHLVWRVCCHRFEHYSAVWDEGWGSVERFGVVEADIVSTVSYGYLEELLRKYGDWIREKSCVIYNSTDWSITDVEGVTEADTWRLVEEVERLGVDGGLDKNGALFLAVGRVASQKGFDIAIKALDYAPHARLLILGMPAGERGYEEYIRGLVWERRGKAALSMAKIPPKLYKALHYVAKALVMPSRWEPFGISAIEAMALGTPVIATKVGGLPEVIDGYGVLVEPENPQELGRAMEGMATGVIKAPPRAHIVQYVDNKFRLRNTVEMLEYCYEKARQFAYFRAITP